MTSYKRKNIEPLKPWGENEVGKVWWDKTLLDYQPYHDTKIFREMPERLARWGGIADFSEVKVYEWVKSALSPQEYEASETSEGEVAVKQMVKRTRTWWQRPVAWRYSANPNLTPRVFHAYQPDRLAVLPNADSTARIVMRTGSFETLGIKKGFKIAGATYSTPSEKTDANLTYVWGTAKVTSDKHIIVVGSNETYADGPIWIESPYFTFSIELDQTILSFNDELLGFYYLDNEQENGKRYVKLTHVDTREFQRLEVRDTPVKSGLLDTYNFDKLGIKINVLCNYGHSVTWPSLGVPSSATRILTLAEDLGNTLHTIALRSAVDTLLTIPFDDGVSNYVDLYAESDDTVPRGWVAWKDPDINPVRGLPKPHNQYEAFTGDWKLVGSLLPDLKDDIALRTKDIWFDGDDLVTPYKQTWSNWEKHEDDVRQLIFNPPYVGEDRPHLEASFTFPGVSTNEMRARARVYVNGLRVRLDRLLFSEGALIGIVDLKLADMIHVILVAEPLTDEEINFDPDVSDDDPMFVTQYKWDYPHTYEERRDINSQKIIKNYYFWVKNKLTPARLKKAGVRKIADLLRQHDGTYGVPQVYKFYNQVDGRPNRYGLVSICDLGHWVRLQSTYKLRLTKNPALRDDDRDIDLKNIHHEWKLLRAFSPIRLPKKLWDLLTDTLCGENQLGQPLPYQVLETYDENHDSFVQYGFDQGQILTEPRLARETVKYTILNTRVETIVDDELITDAIAYPGFDVNLIDEYLATPGSIRKFMTDLWRFAKPKQLNEIFFAVLEDAAASNPELTDFFKTSFISLTDIRVVTPVEAASQSVEGNYLEYTGPPAPPEFATWSDLDKGPLITLPTELSATASAAWNSVRSTVGVSSGKWYWEITADEPVNPQYFAGVGNALAHLQSFVGDNVNGWGYRALDFPSGGGIWHDEIREDYNGSQTQLSVGETIGFKLDMDAGTISVVRGGVDQGIMYTGLTGTIYAMCSPTGSTCTVTANFGQSPFVYSVPLGYNSGLYE